MKSFLGCDDPSIRGAFVDHLQETQSALDRAYVATAIVTNANVGVALSINGFPLLVGAVDRDVILVRGDVAASPVDFTPYQGFGICLRSSGQGCNCSVFLQVPTPFPPPFDTINAERGFVAVDATVDGKAYRFVNTHLEERPPDPTDPLSLIQWAQAAELLQVLQVTTPAKVKQARVVGATVSNKTLPPGLGLWPSDHGAVSAEMQF